MINNKENTDALGDYIKTVMGIVRKFGPFTLSIEDDLTLSIVSDTGWAIVIPRMTDIWSILIDWARIWDEDSQRNVEVYVKLLAYPTSMRLPDIDEEYVNDIIRAHESLTERNMSRKNNENS